MKALFLAVLLLFNSGVANFNVKKITFKEYSLKVDVHSSRVNWHAEKATGSHDGTINVYKGKLNFSGNKLTGGYILIDMQSLKVTDLTSPRKEQLESNLKGDNFFDTGRFTVARFDISRVDYVDPTDLRKVSITGNLDMHGVTRQIVLKTGIQPGAAGTFTARTDVTINRRDWNIATEDFKYNHFISPDIKLQILLKAS